MHEFLEKIREKRSLLTMLGSIALIVAIYFLVRMGTSNLFQGNIGAEEEAPPALPVIASVEDQTPVQETQQETQQETPPEIPTITETPNQETPPEIPEIEDPEDEDPVVTSIKISSHSISPKGFNPQIAETKITYKISAKAKIEIKISDEAGKTIATLVKDETLSSGEHQITWNGTSSTTNDGTVVKPGTYYYKITAKDPDTSATKDTANGSVNAMYALVEEDFETPPPQQNQTPVQTPVNNNAAIVVMQNNTSGQTSETGPETLIYFVLPFAGYLLTRRKKHARK